MRSRMTIALLLGSMCLMHLTGTSFADEKTANSTSMFNQQWLDTVISIEQMQPERDKNGKVVKSPTGEDKLIPAPIGTGFVVKTKNKNLVLVTAKHVVHEETGSSLQSKKGLVYRFNQRAGPANIIHDKDLEAKGRGSWFLSTSSDVACRFFEQSDSLHFRSIPIHMFLPLAQIQTGADLLVLGFPLGLRSEKHPKAIARRGMVALADTTDLLVDSFIFPGNSGGPVLYEPPIKIEEKGLITSPFINSERLVGVISEYIAYQDFASSNQTKRTRVVFEENSGLARAVPSDSILHLLESDDVVKLDSPVDSKQP